MSELQRLRDVTRQLREPGGCDWDRAQNPQSMRPYLLEEIYELIDAVESEDPEHIREELGDVLFLVFFYARLAEEQSLFDIESVASHVAEKLIRRHPHVFGDVRISSVDEILSNWQNIKAAEKAARSNTSTLRAESVVPSETGMHLPALLRAFEIQKKAAAVGFDWTGAAATLGKLQEELDELKAEFASSNPVAVRLESELGDLLFSVVNTARHAGVNPELALNRASTRFLSRFHQMESLAEAEGGMLKGKSSVELDQLWEQAKDIEASRGREF
jgi:tetrapyrrole methylase family protein/MazG family protein